MPYHMHRNIYCADRYHECAERTLFSVAVMGHGEIHLKQQKNLHFRYYKILLLKLGYWNLVKSCLPQNMFGSSVACRPIRNRFSESQASLCKFLCMPSHLFCPLNFLIVWEFLYVRVQYSITEQDESKMCFSFIGFTFFFFLAYYSSWKRREGNSQPWLQMIIYLSSIIVTNVMGVSSQRPSALQKKSFNHQTPVCTQTKEL